MKLSFRVPLLLAATVAVACPPLVAADNEIPVVTDVERQPLMAATDRLIEALRYVGAPLSADDQAKLRATREIEKPVKAVEQIQAILDPHCLAVVTINPESRVSVIEGPVKKELVQQGWRTFLIKVVNEAGINPELRIESPNAAPVYQRGRGPRQRPQTEQKLVTQTEVGDRFLDMAMFNSQPLKPRLSGLPVEYRIVQLYSRDVGRREAKIAFNVGQGTQDIGFRNLVPILFRSVPAVDVALGIRDIDGSPTTAAFVVRDEWNRVYPNPARRLAPDFFFHDQVYREDGETISLPPGNYSVTISRGPEYVAETRKIEVPSGVVSHRENFQLKRWVHAATKRWFSGDHHVHAAGCAHYDSPTEGVGPADMMRHILGEDLNVGCVLSWGPCWYTQKQYFEGRVSDLSTPDYLMRYDVEVSGFPSSHAGHLCLLRLKEDDYPGAEVIEDWPTWTLPVLKWGKDQGGVVGYSHSGWGLALPDYMPDGSRQVVGRAPRPQGWTGRAADRLPDYAMPPFDGIGANEFIVTVAHDVCHFISAVDTPAIWELNIWYHTLNCGFRSRISGETDFPCIYGDKVGLGRIYVKLDEDKELTFDTWIEGVKNGRSYCGDGLSHIFDFKVNNVGVGEPGSEDKISQLNLAKPGKVKVTCDVAAMLEAEPTPATESIRSRRLDQKPYWHIERSRVGDSRKVPVELIVNGEAVARKEVVADGSEHALSFDVDIPKSSWIAVRILPSAHTNPVFVEVGGTPIRASRKSAEWCRKAVDVCWNSKQRMIRGDDRPAAEKAYQEAREIYDRIIRESADD